MTPPAATSTVVRQVTNHRLPAWLRLALWGWAHADPATGHARAYPGQLRQALGPTTTAREVSRALHLARQRGLIDRCSTASCVVLPGHALDPCDAHHRRGGTTR